MTLAPNGRSWPLRSSFTIEGTASKGLTERKTARMRNSFEGHMTREITTKQYSRIFIDLKILVKVFGTDLQVF